MTELFPATRERIDAHHESAVKRALAGETLGLKLLRGSVRQATGELVSMLASGKGSRPDDQRALVMRGINQGVTSLAADAARAARVTRDHSRELARRQVADVLNEGVAAAGVTFGTQAAALPRLVVVPAEATADEDAAQAALVGMRVANRWSAVALSGVSTWRRSGGGLEGLIRQVSRAREETDDRVGVEAATTSFDAFSAESRGALRSSLALAPNALRDVDQGRRQFDLILGGAGGGDENFEIGLPLGWGAGMFEIWSAILDRKTCPRCMDLDGSLVPVGFEWPGVGRPPVHRCCRCVPVAVWIPEAFAKRVPGFELDYAALKDDIRDYMRGSTLNIGAGRRHAASYLAEVVPQTIGPTKPSPQVLAKRMVNREYFSREQPRAPRVIP